MGLDMYFVSTSKDHLTKYESDVNFELDGYLFDISHEIQYYRKHNQLNGWLQNLYHEKGGGDEFNCSTMILTIEDFKRLWEDIANDNLAQASGFFWGNLEITEDIKREYAEFIQEAINHITDDTVVIYYPNW